MHTAIHLRIDTVSSEFLCRFDSWTSRVSSASVSRSRFVFETVLIVSDTVAGRTRSLHSAECVPSFVISHILTRLAIRSPSIAFRHQRKSTFQLSQIRHRISPRTHTSVFMETLHFRLDAKQSSLLSLQSNRETRLAEKIDV